MASQPSPPLTLELKRALYQGDTAIAPGRYHVSVDAADGCVELANASLVHHLTASVRGRVLAVRKPVVELRKAGQEPRWLLLVRLPPGHEWVAVLWESIQR